MSLDPLVAFLNAAKGNHCDKLRAMLTAGDAATRVTGDVLLDDVDQFGNTALLFAAANGHFEASRLLLEFGANVNHANTQYGGRKPIDYARESYAEDCPKLHRLVKLLEQATLTAAEAATRKFIETEGGRAEPSTAADEDAACSSAQSAAEKKEKKNVAEAALFSGAITAEAGQIEAANLVLVACAACRAEKRNEEVATHYATAAVAGTDASGAPFLEPFRWFDERPLVVHATCSACAVRDKQLRDHFAEHPLACNACVAPNASGKLISSPGCGQTFGSPALLYAHQGRASKECPRHPHYQKPTTLGPVHGKLLMSFFGGKKQTISEQSLFGGSERLGSGGAELPGLAPPASIAAGGAGKGLGAAVKSKARRSIWGGGKAHSGREPTGGSDKLDGGSVGSELPALPALAPTAAGSLAEGAEAKQRRSAYSVQTAELSALLPPIESATARDEASREEENHADVGDVLSQTSVRPLHLHAPPART
jgi:hypothetical protein